MPAGLGWFARVFSSGVMVSCPVVCAQTNAKKVPVKTVTESAPPAPKTTKTPEEKPKPVVPRREEPTMQQVMEEVKQKNNYTGCGLIEDSRNRRNIWYVCGRGDSNRPTFHNYDKSKGKDTESRNREVASFSPSQREVTFTNGVKESWSTPFWLSKSGGKELVPKKHCEFQPKESSNSSFGLKCHDQDYPKTIYF